MLTSAEPFLEQQMHPTVIIRAFRQALDDILTICKDEIGWEELQVLLLLSVVCRVFLGKMLT